MPVQYVSVVVSLDRTDREIMKPGQRVKATIALGAEDSIVVPRHVVFERDGKPFVYRHGLHGFEPVDVDLVRRRSAASRSHAGSSRAT